MSSEPATVELDLSACDREPIHLLGSIQPHGVLLSLREDDLRILQASSNAPDMLGIPVRGTSLPDALPAVAEKLGSDWPGRVAEGAAGYLKSVELPTPAGIRSFDIAAHRAGRRIIVELEERLEPNGSEDGFARLRALATSFQGASSLQELCTVFAQQIRALTGFDRALVYRFDEDWHGTVLAEDRNDSLPSYLDLRFPGSDIPAQARELYRRNRLRIIPDAGYQPVPIEPLLDPEAGVPLDLSYSVLRSVSPVHVEYMRNMGTGASMSVSIVIEGRLWGLVSCHNRAPRRVSLAARDLCDLLTQMLAVHLDARERTVATTQRARLAGIQSRLLGYMAEGERFLDGLIRHPEEFLELAGASGAAIVSAEACWLVGSTPPEAAVKDLFEWLSREHREDVFSTDVLSSVLPEAKSYAREASGLLAISVAKRQPAYVLWFRPELVEAVRWGGDPRKPAAAIETGRIHPRQSFEVWKETVRGRSAPWSAAELETARELRNAIIGIVLRQAEELASVSEELQKANKELEAFSYSVSHDLRAPFRHIVGYSELLKAEEGERLSSNGRRYIDVIIESAFSAGTLVDNLLSFSQMGRASLKRVNVDLKLLVEDVRRQLMRDEGAGRMVRWDVGQLGRVHADPVMLRLVVQNLLSNALKYTRGRHEALIEIGRSVDAVGEAAYFVRDNGVGFDMAYVGKLFGVFQRLHRVEEFEGTGIGLANVRRIIERHGGRTWAEGEPGRGATFFFTVPPEQPAEPHA
ncbi:ATP-binding protein [Enterovirga sp. CN4-39]|uniref:ATP-binding protein n=1 Tax=Enterovirga sp. CN4-39 TaxID=3400910 RepID=UPI003C013D7B